MTGYILDVYQPKKKKKSEDLKDEYGDEDEEKTLDEYGDRKEDIDDNEI